jgi:hypothetical protein
MIAVSGSSTALSAAHEPETAILKTLADILCRDGLLIPHPCTVAATVVTTDAA